MNRSVIRLVSRVLGSCVAVSGLATLLSPEGWVPEILIPRTFFGLISVASGIFMLTYPERVPFRNLDSEHRRSRLAFYSLNHGTEMVFWIDSANCLLDVNDRLVSALGFSRQQLIGKPVAFLDQGWVEAQAPEIWSRTAAGTSWVHETVLSQKNGIGLPVSIAVTHYRDNSEEFLCVFAQDIREQKRVSGALKEAQALFASFLSGLPIGAFVRNRQGQFLYFNEQFGAWNPGLKIGHTIREFWSEPVARRLEGEDLQVLDRGAQVFHLESTEGDQRSVFEIHKFPLNIPGIPGLLGGIVTDITARRKVETTLQESRAFLEAIINQSPVGIIILDANTTNILICNAGAKDLLGIDRADDLTGKTVSYDGLIWEVLNPDRTPPPIELNPLYKAFFHQNSSNDKMILRRPDGIERFVVINSGPIYDAKGQFIAAIVAFLDVTELRETQNRLEDLNKSLERMVQSRTQELSRSNEALKITIDNLRQTQDQLIESEKMASLGGLVAGVAHEINTPVGVSVTAASYLKEKTETLADAYSRQAMKKSDLEEFLAMAQQSSSLVLSNLERASNLIKSFKLISVDQSSDLPRRFPLKSYLHEIFLSLNSPDKKRVEVSIEGNEELEILSYPGALSQVLTNLYMNSCHHGFENRPGGLISLSFSTSDDRLILVYQDNGKGMDARTLKRIYEPFFTTRRGQGGSGLGMHIVFNLVTQKLQGTIRTSSEPNRGATFVLNLPLAPGKPSP